MTGPSGIDISALLSAVYRAPLSESDELAKRVRSRVALMNTMHECFCLLFKAPLFAVSATIDGAASADAEQRQPEPSTKPGVDDGPT